MKICTQICTNIYKRNIRMKICTQICTKINYSTLYTIQRYVQERKRRKRKEKIHGHPKYKK